MSIEPREEFIWKHDACLVADRNKGQLVVHGRIISNAL